MSQNDDQELKDLQRLMQYFSDLAKEPELDGPGRDDIFNDELDKRLFDAIDDYDNYDYNEARSLLEQGANPTYTDAGTFLLNVAVLSDLNHSLFDTPYSFVKLLIKFKTNLDARSIFGNSNLCDASPMHEILNESMGFENDAGYFKILNYLLAQPFDLTRQERDGNSYLNNAAALLPLEQIIVIYNKKPTLLNVPNAEGQTPVMTAIENDRRDVARFFFNNGAEPEAAKADGTKINIYQCLPKDGKASYTITELMSDYKLAQDTKRPVSAPDMI